MTTIYEDLPLLIKAKYQILDQFTCGMTQPGDTTALMAATFVVGTTFPRSVDIVGIVLQTGGGKLQWNRHQPCS